MTWTRPKVHTQETKDIIAKLWAEGNSARSIGNQLGLTRNAVIGLVHRMRITSKGCEVRAALPKIVAKAKRTRVRNRIAAVRQLYKPKPVVIVERPIAPVVYAVTNRWVRLTDTGVSTCRYTKDGKLFCNAGDGHPWCAEHREIVFQRDYRPLARRTA